MTMSKLKASLLKLQDQAFVKKDAKDYFVVEADEKVTPPVGIPMVPKLGSLLHNRVGLTGAAKNGRPGGSKGHRSTKIETIRTRLCLQGSVSSSAATALSAVINVDPTASSEISAFQALFDEMKVHGGTLHFHVGSNGGTPTFTDVCVAYDPIDPTALSSVQAGLVSDQVFGPAAALAAGGVTAIIFDPEPVNNTGFWKLTFRCPEGPSKVASATAADQEVATGLWAATNTSVTPKWGFLKPYITSGGASVVLTIYYYLVLDISFRSRA